MVLLSWLYQIRQKRVETWRGAAANGRSKKENLLFRCNTLVSVRRVLSEQSVQDLIWKDKLHVARATGRRYENNIIKNVLSKINNYLNAWRTNQTHSNFLSLSNRQQKQSFCHLKLGFDVKPFKPFKPFKYLSKAKVWFCTLMHSNLIWGKFYYFILCTSAKSVCLKRWGFHQGSRRTDAELWEALNVCTTPPWNIKTRQSQVIRSSFTLWLSVKFCPLLHYQPPSVGFQEKSAGA